MICYLLTDNIPDSIFCYVGITSKPVGARHQQHLENKQANSYKKNWIRYLHLFNYQTQMHTLGHDPEMAYISAYANSPYYISQNDFLQQSWFSSERYSIPIQIYKNSHLEKRILPGFRINNRNQNQPIYYAKPNNLGLDEELIFKKTELWFMNYLQHHDDTLEFIDHLSDFKNVFNHSHSSLIRDILLQYSASQNMFYYDLYTKLIIENADRHRWNLSYDFSELQKMNHILDLRIMKDFLSSYLTREQFNHIWIKLSEWIKDPNALKTHIKV